ncbi:hypothetical protein AX15_007072 [Amanita polypyramis BW_CC]|nr:hypothetical protein AX15_007072 [Amanita polypyramis BW_CC]
MANTLRPWIAKYLFGVSEKYSDRMCNVPTDQRSRTVQLVQFLTYPSETQSSSVWAIASDKSHKLPIQLSADAMGEYQTSNKGRRLTQHKTVIITIKCYRPIFCRVPIVNQGMSKSASLALECEDFSVLGSYGEACFGDPIPINDMADFKLWKEGLRLDGGAGCAPLISDHDGPIKSNNDFKRIYKGTWKSWEDKLLDHPCVEDLEVFEDLACEYRGSSPERVVSEWEATPVGNSCWQINQLSWRELHQILLRTGRSRARQRGKARA